jgi:hypothetical protein
VTPDPKDEERCAEPGCLREPDALKHKRGSPRYEHDFRPAPKSPEESKNADENGPWARQKSNTRTDKPSGDPTSPKPTERGECDRHHWISDGTGPEYCLRCGTFRRDAALVARKDAEIASLRDDLKRLKREWERLKNERKRLINALGTIGSLASAAGDVTRPFDPYDVVSINFPRESRRALEGAKEEKA